MRLIILILLLALSQAEYFNFDYSQHGANWGDMAPPPQNWSACASRTYQFI